jgi:hypothetical protein
MHRATRIGTLQTPRALPLGRVNIVTAVEHRRQVITWVNTARQRALTVFGPARSAHLVKERWHHLTPPLRRYTIQHLPPLRVGGDRMPPKNRLQVAAPPPLLHLALKFPQTGVLKEHHGKAAQQRVVQAIIDTVGASDIGNVIEGL